MNDDSNPPMLAPNQKSRPASTDRPPDKNKQQSNMQNPGDGTQSQGQAQFLPHGDRSGTDRGMRSGDAKSANPQRPGEDRTQGPSSHGTSEPSTSDTDVDTNGARSDHAVRKQQNKPESNKATPAVASKSITNGKPLMDTSSTLDKRGKSNPKQGGRKN